MKSQETKHGTLKNLFSKLSISFSCLTLLLTIVLIRFMPATIKVKEGFPVIPKWLIVSTEISCLLGVVFSIVSLAKKEKLRYWKVTGAILNILFFLFFTGIIGFAFLMDWRRRN